MKDSPPEAEPVDSGEFLPAPVPARETAVVPQDPLSLYLAEAGRHPLLSREEEHALAVRVHDQGDPVAAEKLVLSNLRLVVKIAKDYRRVWTQLLDLIQEGNIGLLQAVRRFDPYRGVKLSSYAGYWIRAFILKYLIDNIRLVRVGSSRNERKLFFQLNRTRRELERAGFAAEPKLLAEKLDVDEGEVIDLERRLSQSDLSLEAPSSGPEDGSPLGDRLPQRGQSMESELIDRDSRSTLLEYVERFAQDLDERENTILRERILAEERRTLREIGEEFGLTRERVRQIEARLVDKLREYLKENLVDFEYWAPED
ncbi:MAG: RNA polymerase sigma factor RpoD/SigA [Myxococcota bacterium]